MMSVSVNIDVSSWGLTFSWIRRKSMFDFHVCSFRLIDGVLLVMSKLSIDKLVG